MYCVNCHEKFYPLRRFLDFFQTKKSYLCFRCQSRFPLRPELHRVSLLEDDLLIVSLFEKPYRMNTDGYLSELSKIMAFFFKKSDEFLIFFSERWTLTDLWLEIFQWLWETERKRILIITFYLRK